MDIKKILSDGEKVEQTSKANMAPFLIPICLTAALVIAGIIMIIVNTVNSFVFGIVALVVAGFVLIYSLTRLEYLLSTKIYVTDKRVILKSGIFNSVQSELPIDKISGVTIVEPLLGKLFHYGTVIVESSAAVSGVRAKYINQPYDFKKTIKIEQK